MKGKSLKRYGAIIAFLAVAALALGGCSGSDGAAGPAGATGATGPAGPAGPIVTNIATLSAEQLKAATFTGEITGVSIASPAVVDFWIKDAAGNGVTGLGAVSGTSLNYLRFAIAKLVPGTSGSPDQWVSYMVTDTSRPTSERVPANLVDKGNGYYTYTFAKDLATVPGVTYEPTRTHRLVIQFSGTVPGTTNAIENPINIVKDFVPAGGALPLSREITTTAACNDCHTKIGVTTPHGGRVDTRYCVVCHTDQRKIGRTNTASTANAFTGTQYIADGVVLGDMVPMIHKTHMGNQLTKTGYDYAGVKFNHIGYPQQKTNCRKCHTASAAAPQGDNWKNKPSRTACGACHDGIDWATGSGKTIAGATTGHIGGKATSDALCYVCHDAASIDAVYHVTENKTTNNPNVPTGAANFTYEISSATVNASNQAVIKFRILSSVGAAAAAPVTLATPAAGLTASLAGFTGGPSFLLSYAMPQDGIAAPADYNNLGRTAAQPATISIANLLNTNNAASTGSITGPDASGYYTATIVSAAAFPVGATMRAVGLQGYYTQVSPAVARHAVSVIKAVTGDAVRRVVVDDAKCGKCHEWLELHGGNRVNTVAVCVTCHNPNLSTSGRAAAPATVLARLAIGSPTAVTDMTAAGYTPADPLTFPEASNNMKEMIHGIHASHARTNPYRFVRDRGASGVYYYDWSHVTYPAILKNCESCHRPGTYGSIPANVLPTTNVTTGRPGATYDWGSGKVTDGETLTTNVLAARTTTALPGANNLVLSPYAGTCVFCHDSSTARAHMTANGGQLNVARSAYNAGAEQCVICHGPGRSSDVSVKHK